jgi:hypothetical protein
MSWFMTALAVSAPISRPPNRARILEKTSASSSLIVRVLFLLLQRVAAAFVAPVEALSGNVAPVGRGVTVELIELRPEDVASGNEPGAVARTTTNAKGEYCVALVADTTVDVCRYAVRVGSRDDGTRTRALVYSTDEAIDIDYASEATVQVILDGIPPADLCDFSPAEIADRAVVLGEDHRVAFDGPVDDVLANEDLLLKTNLMFRRG